MIENQAYIVALMLLIASPIAIASDEGQAVLERFDQTPDDLIDIEKSDPTEDLDNLLREDILNDRPFTEVDTKAVVEDCYTLEQWKERLAERDWNKEDWERESDEVREESNDGARGNSDDKKEKEDYNKETDKVTVKATDKDCFTEAEFEEFVGKLGKDERKGKKDCVTVGQIKEKWERIREEDRVWDDEDEDDRDDESDEERDNDEDEGDDDESNELTIIHDSESSDEDHDLNDEERAELFAAIGELKEACEDGDEAACVELRELMEEHLGGWEREERDWGQKDRDDSKCVGKHLMDRMKEKFGRDRGEKDRDGEWEELRAVMAELGAACEGGDEIACEELEELITELENDEREREEECDEHDENDHDENDHDEDDEDDSGDEEDDSEDDEPEEA